ncbi:hypothetical protein NECAME_06527 [Necator americanus]|uniref:Uncharacterized protein n=1 Tax=Necator americanus TaxID=51031 RepID=W2TTM2_NECAM|nr:hypothetical protein NECAME_06527 [Necator americanus]ETN85138.1 hypothetical protein NECAME_06527 [Necator americanus]
MNMDRRMEFIIFECLGFCLPPCTIDDIINDAVRIYRKKKTSLLDESTCSENRTIIVDTSINRRRRRVITMPSKGIIVGAEIMEF